MDQNETFRNTGTQRTEKTYPRERYLSPGWQKQLAENVQESLKANKGEFAKRKISNILEKHRTSDGVVVLKGDYLDVVMAAAGAREKNHLSRMTLVSQTPDVAIATAHIISASLDPTEELGETVGFVTGKGSNYTNETRIISSVSGITYKKILEGGISKNNTSIIIVHGAEEGTLQNQILLSSLRALKDQDRAPFIVLVSGDDAGAKSLAGFFQTEVEDPVAEYKAIERNKYLKASEIRSANYYDAVEATNDIIRAIEENEPLYDADGQLMGIDQDIVIRAEPRQIAGIAGRLAGLEGTHSIEIIPATGDTRSIIQAELSQTGLPEKHRIVITPHNPEVVVANLKLTTIIDVRQDKQKVIGLDNGTYSLSRTDQIEFERITSENKVGIESFSANFKKDEAIRSETIKKEAPWDKLTEIDGSIYEVAHAFEKVVGIENALAIAAILRQGNLLSVEKLVKTKTDASELEYHFRDREKETDGITSDLELELRIMSISLSGEKFPERVDYLDLNAVDHAKAKIEKWSKEIDIKINLKSLAKSLLEIDNETISKILLRELPRNICSHQNGYDYGEADTLFPFFLKGEDDEGEQPYLILGKYSIAGSRLGGLCIVLGKSQNKGPYTNQYANICHWVSPEQAKRLLPSEAVSERLEETHLEPEWEGDKPHKDIEVMVSLGDRKSVEIGTIKEGLTPEEIQEVRDKQMAERRILLEKEDERQRQITELTEMASTIETEETALKYLLTNLLDGPNKQAISSRLLEIAEIKEQLSKSRVKNPVEALSRLQKIIAGLPMAVRKATKEVVSRDGTWNENWFEVFNLTVSEIPKAVRNEALEYILEGVSEDVIVSSVTESVKKNVGAIAHGEKPDLSKLINSVLEQIIS